MLVASPRTGRGSPLGLWVVAGWGTGREPEPPETPSRRRGGKCVRPKSGLLGEGGVRGLMTNAHERERSLRLGLALLQRPVPAGKGQRVPAAAGGSVGDQLPAGGLLCRCPARDRGRPGPGASAGAAVAARDRKKVDPRTRPPLSCPGVLSCPWRRGHQRRALGPAGPPTEPLSALCSLASGPRGWPGWPPPRWLS